MECYYLTRLDIFDTFTQAWFLRQKKKLLSQEQITDIWDEKIEADFALYCEGLAYHMWRQGLTEVHYQPVTRPVVVSALVSSLAVSVPPATTNLWDEFFSKDGFFRGDHNKPLALVRSGCPLQLKGNDHYSFLHKSLLEYFGAKTLHRSAITKGSIAIAVFVKEVVDLML